MTSTTGPIIYSRPLPSSGGSENECIHTERRSSTGDKDGGEIMKAIDDTPRSSRTFEVTIPCPHCRRLLDVFLKEAS
jgi:hypothetical protein